MLLRTQKDAAAVAMEMERRAISVYERALMLPLESSAREAVRQILQEERGHLVSFTELYHRYEEQPSRDRLLLKSVAAEVLFSGGVMQMERAEALTDRASVYAFAIESEKEAVARYTDLADRCPDPEAAGVFRAIAEAESHHRECLEAER